MARHQATGYPMPGMSQREHLRKSPNLAPRSAADFQGSQLSSANWLDRSATAIRLSGCVGSPHATVGCADAELVSCQVRVDAGRLESGWSDRCGLGDQPPTHSCLCVPRRDD